LDSHLYALWHPHHGRLRIGGTVTESETVRIIGIPSFAPEILRHVNLDDPIKSRHPLLC
jgi:peptide chain release factor 3